MRRRKSRNTQEITLSLLVPVFNEAATIIPLLVAVKKVDLPNTEVIVIDDASSDKTVFLLKKFPQLYDQLILHRHNQGKSAAVQSGLKQAKGKITVIQDADMEYDPRDIPQLIEPIVEGRADVVYGSRFQGHLPHRMVYFTHYVMNKLLTLLCNLLTNLNLSDMETGYKALRTELFREVSLFESGFALEPELTLKVASRKAIFYEVGVRYYGRTYEEGKKIGLLDGIQAVYVLCKYGIVYRLLGIQL